MYCSPSLTGKAKMSIPDVRPGATVLALLLLAPAAHSASTLYSFSNACGNGYSPNCTSDYRFGDPAVSSVSRPESYSSPGGGGYNYGAEARAAARVDDVPQRGVRRNEGGGRVGGA